MLLGLFGDGFESGYPVMFVMVVGYLIRASVGPAEFVLRMLGEQSGLMNPVSRLLWRALGISGRPSRFRSEPTYTAA